MLISIAVCTLNHADSLHRTLQSFVSMRVPPGTDWEVVVVNNGCTDHTDEILTAFTECLPLRCELEPKAGLSRARNRAVEVVRGEYVLWTDDDVVVDPDWLCAYTAAFRRWPNAAVFGGPILPRYAPPVPEWVLQGQAELRGVFAHLDIGPSERLLWDSEQVCLPWGPNFALRGTEQRQFRYNLKLGLAPGQTRRNEEIEVIERIRRSGATGYWVPDARVEHCARPEMQTMRYVCEWHRSFGEAVAFQAGRPERAWFGAPPWAWRRLVEGWLSYQVHRRVSSPDVWLRYFRLYNSAFGAISHWRRHSGHDL